MKITEILLSSAARPSGGYTKRQLALLGINWPPPKGWKESLIGNDIDENTFAEFLKLGNAQNNHKSPVNWCGAPDPIDIYLYVLELEDSCFYVGLTSDLDNRIQQHFSGEGAEWTKQHRPIKLLESINTGTRDGREAEYMEDEVTITLMIHHGMERVRGGHFSYLEQSLVEQHLHFKGAWERVFQAKLDRTSFDTNEGWASALDDFLKQALTYYEDSAPPDQKERVFTALYKLTKHRYWRDDYCPALAWEFWNRKGILPVLLSFKFARTIGSNLASPFDVLAAALNRGKSKGYPFRRIYLLGWTIYQPDVTPRQSLTLARFMDYLTDGSLYDNRYDSFVSVLLPETRYILRSNQRPANHRST